MMLKMSDGHLWLWFFGSRAELHQTPVNSELGKEPHLRFSQQTVGPDCFSLARSGDFLLCSGFQLKDWFAQEPCEEHVPVCAAAPTRVVPPATGKYESLTRQTLSSSADHP